MCLSLMSAKLMMMIIAAWKQNSGVAKHNGHLIDPEMLLLESAHRWQVAFCWHWGHQGVGSMC